MNLLIKSTDLDVLTSNFNFQFNTVHAVDLESTADLIITVVDQICFYGNSRKCLEKIPCLTSPSLPLQTEEKGHHLIFIFVYYCEENRVNEKNSLADGFRKILSPLRSKRYIARPKIGDTKLNAVVNSPVYIYGRCHARIYTFKCLEEFNTVPYAMRCRELAFTFAAPVYAYLKLVSTLRVCARASTHVFARAYAKLCDQRIYY